MEKQYLLIGSTEEVLQRMRKWLKEVKRKAGNDNTDMDNDAFKILDSQVWVSLEAAAKFLQVDVSFFSSDKMLDLMNTTKRETGQFPIITI